MNVDWFVYRDKGIFDELIGIEKKQHVARQKLNGK